MKKFIMPCLAGAAFLLLAACANNADKAADTVDDTVTTVAHKTDPFAEDTTTTTVQKSMQQPVDSAATRDARDSN